MCARKAKKPASRAVVWLGRDEGFLLGNGKTGMQGERGGGRGARSAACFAYQKQKMMHYKCTKE